MSTEPEHIRAEIDALLSELPGLPADGADLVEADLDAVAARLEAAHEVLVRALESVENAPIPAGGSAATPGIDPAGSER